MQRGLSATYLARISTIFETTDVNRCQVMTGVKYFKFLRRDFCKSKERNFRGFDKDCFVLATLFLFLFFPNFFSFLCRSRDSTGHLVSF